MESLLRLVVGKLAFVARAVPIANKASKDSLPLRLMHQNAVLLSIAIKPDIFRLAVLPHAREDQLRLVMPQNTVSVELVLLEHAFIGYSLAQEA